MKFIKQRWKAISNSLAGTEKYFKKSPSNIVQQSALKSLLQQYANKTFLDIGAGRSVYKKILPAGIEYHALDYEETEGGYNKDSSLDIVGDVQDMPIENNTYDSILCSEVLEHVPHPAQAAKEIMRVLKPGGTAIITVPFLGYYHDEPYDFFRFTKHGLRILFSDAGAEIVEQQALGGLCCFLGYIRSTIVLSLCYRIPVLWTLAFYCNYLLSIIDLALDSIFHTGSVMPLTNIIVVRKQTQT
ncbi:class I SAM-dependent methyltransferase [Patescibacteria group bacterium]